MNQLRKARKTPKKIMDAARGESCTLNIAGGVCDWGTETTVYAHLPDGSGGSNRLTGAISGCFACHNCHAKIDGRMPPALSEADKWFYIHRAMVRTVNILVDRGLVKVDGLKY